MPRQVNFCLGFLNRAPTISVQTPMKTRSLGLLVLLLAFQVARAQSPSGTLSYDIDGSNGPLLWNSTGVELFDPPVATVDHQDSFGILWANRWPVGRISGDTTNTYVRAWFRDSFWEQQYFPYGGIAVFQTESLNLTVDPDALALAGTQTISEKRVEFSFFFRHFLSSSNDTTDVSFPLTDGNDGHWNLELNLTAFGNYVRGSATITFANAETQQFRVNGKTSIY